MKKISLVIPVFNEEENIRNTFFHLSSALLDIGYKWEVVVVNDGSTDDTMDRLREIASPFELVIVDMSRNFGKEAALSAGLAIASGDAVIPLDADLQDPPTLLPLMLEKWESGFEVVLAQRNDRSSDSYLKRKSALGFYRLINRLSDISIPENVGDFRLMDRIVVDAINRLSENQRFMKGLLAWAGFKTTTIHYARPERAFGQSKFNGWRLWNLAIEGITSFSTVPLRIWTYIGFAVALCSLIYGFATAVKTLIFGIDVPGYASLLCAVLFMSGIQLTGIGVLGEYIGRSYIESKRRPAYIIRKVINIRTTDDIKHADMPASLNATNPIQGKE